MFGSIPSSEIYGETCTNCSTEPDSGYCNCIGWQLDCDGACNEYALNTLDDAEPPNCCLSITQLTYYPDVDGDGFGENVNSKRICAGASTAAGTPKSSIQSKLFNT